MSQRLDKNLVLTILAQFNLYLAYIIYKRKLMAYYIQANMKYLVPKVGWSPRCIPEAFHEQFGPQEFKKFYRMTFSTFELLIELLKENYLEYNGNVRIQSLFSWKCGIYIRFLARSECLGSLKHTFGCCAETIRASIHGFKSLILYSMSNSLKIDINDEDSLRQSSEAIKGLTDGLLDGFAFIIDGTHIPIIKIPSSTPKQCFVNRKGGKSINCQVVINAALKVVAFECGYPGSTNDSQMLNSSGFLSTLKDIHAIYNGRYACLADNGYPTREYMMTPYTAAEILSNPDTENDKVQFNAIFSSVRQAIERVFGILQPKWYLLAIGCEYKIEDYLQFVQTIMMLHNFMIDNESSYKLTIMNESWTLGGTPATVMEAILHLNEIRNDPDFILESPHVELVLGEQKRDILRRNLPLVRQIN